MILFRSRWRHRDHPVTSKLFQRMSKTKTGQFFEIETGRISASLEGSNLKSTPERLRSRKPLRFFVESLSTNEEPTTPIPPALQSLIPAYGPQPPSCDHPRNAWAQLNRLRTGVTNIKLMGLCGSDMCECGKVQTAHQILLDCTKFKRPCHISEVDNPTLLEYLAKSSFWRTCPHVYVYERRGFD